MRRKTSHGRWHYISSHLATKRTLEACLSRRVGVIEKYFVANGTWCRSKPYFQTVKFSVDRAWGDGATIWHGPQCSDFRRALTSKPETSICICCFFEEVKCFIWRHLFWNHMASLKHTIQTKSYSYGLQKLFADCKSSAMTTDYLVVTVIGLLTVWIKWVPGA